MIFSVLAAGLRRPPIAWLIRQKSVIPSRTLSFTSNGLDIGFSICNSWKFPQMSVLGGSALSGTGWFRNDLLPQALHPEIAPPPAQPKQLKQAVLSRTPALYPEIIPSQAQLKQLREEIGDPNEERPTKAWLNGIRNVFAMEVNGLRRCVKFGWRVHAREAMSMEYVRRNTKIPVPQVHWFWRDDERHQGFIVMELIQSACLERIAVGMPAAQREHVAAQIVDYVQQLRALGGTSVNPMGSWNPKKPQQPVTYDNVFFTHPVKSLRPTAPFQSLEELRQYCLSRRAAKVPPLSTPPHLDINGVADQVFLTHGDMSPRNILVEGSNVVAILDWDTFGWYPGFWERCYIWYALPYDEWEDTLSADNQLLWRRMQLQQEAGVNHLTNWGAKATYGQGFTTNHSVKIVVKAMSRSERLELETIANTTPVRIPDGRYNCQDWVKTVLSTAVDQGLLTQEDYERIVQEAERVTPR
ncbi:kinase-like domain-containing protein [Coprinopsis sp. MPI-PUGE-AT-0042]|nr:kinase-like domain-containing protein [Coprinopsis sp. MPI-PUGE-AT-0042]